MSPRVIWQRQNTKPSRDGEKKSSVNKCRRVQKSTPSYADDAHSIRKWSHTLPVWAITKLTLRLWGTDFECDTDTFRCGCRFNSVCAVIASTHKILCVHLVSNFDEVRYENTQQNMRIRNQIVVFSMKRIWPQLVLYHTSFESFEFSCFYFPLVLHVIVVYSSSCSFSISQCTGDLYA